MTQQTLQDAARALADILTREHELLISGKVRDAADFNDRKLEALEAFTAALGSISPSDLPESTRDIIRSVLDLSQKNEGLFKSVRNGLRSLIDRFEKPADDSFVGCYAPGGNSVAFTGATGSYRKKI